VGELENQGPEVAGAERVGHEEQRSAGCAVRLSRHRSNTESGPKLGRDIRASCVFRELVRKLSKFRRLRRAGAGREQDAHDFEMPCLRCSYQDGFPVVVRRVGIGAAFEEEANDRDVAAIGSRHQRGVELITVGLVDFGTALEEQTNDIGMPARRTSVQSRLVAFVELVDCRAGIEEATDFGDVSALGGFMQGRHDVNDTRSR